MGQPVQARGVALMAAALPYVLRYPPPCSASGEEENRIPLLLYLHGAGGRSDSFDEHVLLQSAPVKECDAVGLALLAPQAPRTPPATLKTTEWGHSSIASRVMALLGKPRSMQRPLIPAVGWEVMCWPAMRGWIRTVST